MALARYTVRKMRPTIIAIVCALFVVTIQGQKTDSTCPTIDLTGPNNGIHPGDTLTFAVTLGATPANVKYVWTVSHGVIEKGQGTQSIIVRTTYDDQGAEIEAAISIEGLPAECKNVASEVRSIKPMGPWEIVDEWGRLPSREQRARLDSVFQGLENYPDYIGLFYIAAEKKEGSKMLQQKMNLILDHIKFRSFDKSRFIFALTDWDMHRIKAYFYRPGQWHKIDCEPPCKLIYGRDLK